MNIDSSIKIKVMDGVYNPAEDSYLLIKAIDVEGRENALDMGCGTGIISLHLAKKGCSVTAVDVNENAIRNAMLNATQNGFNIRFIKSNLFENIEESFDLIAFNPPYLPTENKEDITWDGGKGGIETIERFLRQVIDHLNQNGKIYLVISSLSDINKILEEFKDIYQFHTVGKEKLFFEKLYVYRITKKHY